METIMMSSFKIWLHAFRPRTLLLVVAGTVSAIAVASPYEPNYIAASLVFLTALSLQILSNISNDYGDTIHGADNVNRVGPPRAVQKGLISPAEMRRAIIVAIAVCAVFGGLLMIYVYRMIGPLLSSAFLLAGILSIWAAIAYTATDKPYGYVGLGDLMVFAFFGVVMVVGGSWLIAGVFIPQSIFIGAGIGFLSTAVLNINNMRDLETDEAGGKHTIAVRLGPDRVRGYHLGLLIAAGLSFTGYSLAITPIWLNWLWVLTIPFFIRNALDIHVTPRHELDRFLPQTVLLTTAASILLLLTAILAH